MALFIRENWAVRSVGQSDIGVEAKRKVRCGWLLKSVIGGEIGRGWVNLAIGGPVRNG